MQDQAAVAAKTLIVKLYAEAIKRSTRIEDRLMVIDWFTKARDILASQASMSIKLQKLYSLTDTQAITKTIVKTIAKSASTLRKTKKLSFSVKLGLGLTVLLMPFFGGQSAGIAAFGTAVGLPVLLLIFIGTTGITSIIESLAIRPEKRAASSMNSAGPSKVGLVSSDEDMKLVTDVKRHDARRVLPDN